MMNKRLNIFYCLLILISFNSKLFSQNKSHYKTLKSISEIKYDSPDTCYLKCFVVSSYTCPPCPPGAECKPCIGDNLTVVDDMKENKFNFRLFTKATGKYTIGKKYTFLIKIHKYGSKDVYEASVIEK